MREYAWQLEYLLEHMRRLALCWRHKLDLEHMRRLALCWRHKLDEMAWDQGCRVVPLDFLLLDTDKVV